MLALAIGLTVFAAEVVVLIIAMIVASMEGDGRPGSWEWWGDIGAVWLIVHGFLVALAAIVAFLWLLFWVWGEAL